jgi:methionine sulfoxide reductase heme-binding subunit
MSQALWYLSRGTGVVALVLFTVSVVFGALGSGRFTSARWPRFAVAGVHRNVSLLAIAFLVAHIATATIDPYAGIGWLDSIVPFGSAYRPLWLGLGAIATDLALAIALTSLARPRINLRAWRYVHWTSYACWPLAVFHGIGTDPADFRIPWVVAVYAVCVLAVLVSVGWRLTTSHHDTRARQVTT